MSLVAVAMLSVGAACAPVAAPETPPSLTRAAGPAWPMSRALAPEIAVLPAVAEQSIESVAAYVVAHQPDPWLQLRALHDWTATRMTYEVDEGMRLAEAWRIFPPGSAAGRPRSSCYLSWNADDDQPLAFLCPERAADGTWVLDPGARIAASNVMLIPDPEAVFASRKGMCADYAALLTALGRAAGIEVAYVTGQTRVVGSSVMQAGRHWSKIGRHAWNVARVGGEVRPIDVTWDAEECGWGSCDVIGTDWLFTPPAVFEWTHLADDPRWRLGAAQDMDRRFHARPILYPRFFALGLTWISPTTQPVSSRRDVELMIDAPADASIRVEPRSECRVRVSGGLRIADCAFGADPPSEILVFAASRGEPYDLVGAVAVQAPSGVR